VLARVRFSFWLDLILLDFALFLLFNCHGVFLWYYFRYSTRMLVVCHRSIAYRLDIALLVLLYSTEHRDTETPREYVFIRDNEKTEPTPALTTRASNKPQHLTTLASNMVREP
jgi:hypothetical protein